MGQIWPFWPISFHIRKRLFHHAWLMPAILVHFMLQWRSSSVRKRPKSARDIQFLIREKSRLWGHLEQLSTSPVCDNSDFPVVQKILNKMYISGFVNTICGTKMCEMTKNKRTITFIQIFNSGNVISSCTHLHHLNKNLLIYQRVMILMQCL